MVLSDSISTLQKRRSRMDKTKKGSPSGCSTDRTIGSWEVGAYLLSTCATVDEAIDALKNKVRVVEEECPPFKMVLPLHYWIGDSTGRVVIAEYVAGELHIHEAPLGVLTNSPPYEWQTLNVANYVNLSPINSPPVDLGRVQLDNVNQGTGFVGLPGDFTPPSRFVRAALFSHWATQADTAKDTVNLGFHILNTFDIFNGAIQAKASGSASATTNTDITEWVVAHDRTNHKTYIRTYGGLAFQMIDLNKIDFAKPGFRTIELQTDFAPADITESTQPLAQQ
jgi:choloylglycine hydrolase